MTPTKKSPKPLPKDLPKKFKVYNVYLNNEIKGLGRGLRSLIVWEKEDKIIYLDWMRLKYGTAGKTRFKRLYPERVKGPALSYIKSRIEAKIYKMVTGRKEIEQLLKAIK